MPRQLFCLLLGAVALAGVRPVAAQSLAQRLERAAPDRDVTFQVPSLPDVCGYGDAVIRFHPDARGGRGYSVMWQRGESADLHDLDAASVRAGCEFGPVQVTLRRDGRTVERVLARVAGSPPAGTLDLGAVATAEAADYLVGTLARQSGRRVAGEAMAVFVLTQGDSWPPLLALARDQEVARETRKQAVFWLGQAASRRAVEGLESILGDDEEELEVRESAVFALSQQRDDRAVEVLMELAQSSREPAIRKSALFWLGQKADDDPRVLALFERILLGKS